MTTHDTVAYARMARVIRYIDAHFAERPSLARLATVAGLSPAHFSREFRRWAGLAPTQYVKRLAVLAAKESLATDAPVIAAAWESGLSGGGRLHDLFVTFEAMTPGEFKAGGATLTLTHGFAPTPFGRAHFASTKRGLAWLAFADGTEHAAVGRLATRWPQARLVRDDAAAGVLAERIFAGGTGRLPLCVRGTNFQVRVWEALLELGRRGPLSYGALARAIGRPGAARAVGQAVGGNPVAWIIPCHRVLTAAGELGGYRWGLDRKRSMLAWELARAGA